MGTMSIVAVVIPHPDKVHNVLLPGSAGVVVTIGIVKCGLASGMVGSMGIARLEGLDIGVSLRSYTP